VKPAASALAAAVAALAVASAAYQAAGEARDRRRYPPPGRLVDVGGHRLHVMCAGDGGPAVVIIPAMGALAAEWQAVQDGLAGLTTVCVYDRAGLGWSDAAPSWPTATAMARELHALLGAAAIERPVVLAGHSAGGLVARVFTALYPAEVAALALVDSSHPEQDARLPKVHLRDHRGGKIADLALEFAWPLGLRRLRGDLSRESSPSAVTALKLTSRSRRAFAKELLAFNAVCRQAAAVAGDLGSLPLAVVTSSERAPGQPVGSRAQRDRSRFYPGWAQLQDELAELSTDSVHVVAANAGHHLNRDDPELVVEVIADLVHRVRQP
jgi:pimeloyl-ACP methyl ester carboxylesterase